MKLGTESRDSRSILILGPHRSGTSALTRVLNLLGVDLGDDLLPPNFDNQRGYWEHRGLFELHERLLSCTGSSWHDHRAMPLGWRELEDVEEIRGEILSLLREELVDSPLWGVKDPRLCRLLPFWLDLLEELSVEAGFVILVRNPLEVARSLQRRNRFSPSKCRLLYLAEMLAAVRHTEGRCRAFVSYSRLLEDWRGVVDDLARELQIDWPQEPEQRAPEIDSFLRPSERHHQVTLDDLRRDPHLPDWATELYEALERSSHGNREALAPALRKADEGFRSAVTLFGPELDTLQAEVERLSARVERLESRDSEVERARLERRAERAEAELSKVQAHLTSLLRSPVYRSTRSLHRLWQGLVRFRH